MRVQKFINFFFSHIACIPLLGIIQLSTKNYPTKGKNFQAFICHNSLEKFSHNKLPKTTIQLQQADPLQNKSMIQFGIKNSYLSYLTNIQENFILQKMTKQKH